MSCLSSHTQNTTQQDTRVIFQLLRSFTGSHHFLRIIEKPLSVNANNGCRDDTKSGQGREASTNIRLAMEDVHKPVCSRPFIQTGPRICYGDKMTHRCFSTDRFSQKLQEIGHENIGFQRTTRLAGDNKRCVFKVNHGFHRLNLRRIGRVQHDQLGITRLLPEGLGDDLGCHAGTTHPQQHDLPDATIDQAAYHYFHLIKLLPRLLHNIQPPQPVSLIAATPE